MLDLGSLKLGIKVDSAEAKTELKEVKSSVKETASEIKDKIVAGTKVAAAGFMALGTAAVALAENTREYRTEQAKLETAFTTAGFSAEAAKQTYEELNGVLGDSGQATEAANHLAMLCDTEEELQSWTNICTGVYATFGDSLPIEGLTEAANETAKTGALTGSLADALNWAGISEDTFQAQLDACTSEQERQNLITQTLTGTYSDASVQYQKTAADVIAANKANQKMTDSMAKLGAVIEPVITIVKTFAAQAISRIADLIAKLTEFLSKNKTLQAALSTIWNAIKTIVSTAINAILTVVNIGGKLYSIGKSVFTNFYNAAKAVWSTITSWITGRISAFKNLFSNISLAGAGRSVLSSFLSGLQGIWSSIVGWVESKVSWISNKFSAVKNFIGGIMGSHRTGLREVPFDGYVAELHKGEMVLTAAEAKRYKQGTSGNSSVTNLTVNNYSPKALNEAETARQYRKVQRELALGF